MPKKLTINLGSNFKDFFAFEAINKFDKGFYIVLTLMVSSLFLLFALTQYIFLQTDNLIDYNVFLLVSQMTNSAGVKIAKIITILGTGNFLIPAYILILVFLAKRNYTGLFYKTSITATSGLLLGWLLKWIFHRSRPQAHLVSGAGGYSFPSGHALGGFIFCGIVIYLIWKMKFSYFIRWTCSILISLLGFCIGISRIYLHVHYVTDVLGSFIIAIWWLSLMHILFRIIFNNTLSRVTEPVNLETFKRKSVIT